MYRLLNREYVLEYIISYQLNNPLVQTLQKICGKSSPISAD